MGLFGFGKKEKDKMKDGLEKTRTGFWGNIMNTLTGSKIDDDLYDELEEQLILADVGGEVAIKLVDKLRDRVNEKGLKTGEQASDELRDLIADEMRPEAEMDLSGTPAVILVIADTAGRLHNKANLMAELSKISRSVKKASPEASLETLLVLDAITGQNAISQAREFCKAANATGIILTKLDGTAKGGCVVAVKQRLGLPVRFIGVGEGIDDLIPFTPEGYVEELLPRQWKH